MYDYLIFQLYGPMASWGEIAVGEVRQSHHYPGKSALVGLVAAALGIERSDEQQQLALTDSLQFGLQVFSGGSLIRDYHTTQVPPNERKRVFYTREQELVHSSKLNTVLSTRDHRADAYLLVAVSVGEDSAWSLEQIEAALKSPVYTLYLGRKSCPLAAPLDAQRVSDVPGLKAAFARYERKPLCLSRKNGDNWLGLSEPFYVWEGDAGDLVPEQSHTRHDRPISRQRWQFGQRREHLAYGENV